MTAPGPARYGFIASTVQHIKRRLSAKQGVRRYIGPKRVAILLVMAIVVATAWELRSAGYLDPAVLVRLADERPLYVVTSFVMFYSVSVLTTLPTLPFNLAAGYLWGPLWGGVIATVATTLGALAAFGITRSVFGQPLARRMASPLAARVQQDFEQQGWKILAFLRLNPVVPTGVLNYVLPLTSARWQTVSWTTFVFLLPPSMVVAYIGHELGTFVADGGARQLVRLVLAVSAAVVVLAGLKYASKLIKRNEGTGP
jgi:uncharacterized membrane protein YdjX (TVP38/TMEM64 family)